jgi:hypothetical protein
MLAPLELEAASAKMSAIVLIEDALSVRELGEVQVAAKVHLEEDRPLIGQRHVPGLCADAGKDGGCLAREVAKLGPLRE